MKNNSLKHGLKSLLLMASLGTLSACEEFLDIPMPTNSITAESVFQSQKTIDQNQNSMYVAFTTLSTTLWTFSAWSDEAYNPTSGSINYMTGYMALPYTDAKMTWRDGYVTLVRANLLLEGLPAATVVDEVTRKTYLGTAYTVRAAAHYYLVRTYGDVPINTSSDVVANAKAPRTPAAEVYAQVISDLDEAIALLPPTGKGDERFIDNKYIPLALSARVYTTLANWPKAEAAADAVIKSGGFQLVTTPGDVFWRGNNEIIFANGNYIISSQAQMDFPSIGSTYNPPSTSYESYCMALSVELQNSFESGDLRKTAWVYLSNSANYSNPNNRYFCKKYNSYMKPVAGKQQELVFLRLAEMYLIRAEARARQNNLAGAAADLDVIRNRAGLPNTTAATQTDLINAILRERRIELCYEVATRWDDLVRTGTANAVLSALPWKTEWKSHQTLWPIPDAEMKLNDALVQNPGYQ